MQTNQLKETIGNRLRAARKEQDLSQEDVARQLGVTTGAYGAFERGTNLIALNYLIGLSRILNKAITFFLPGYIVSDSEIQNADPLLRRLLDAWPQLSPRLRQSLVDLVEHTISHKNAP